jgi:hypothetical protein
MTRKWLQSQDVSVDDASGALLVQLLTDGTGAVLVKLLSDAATPPSALSASGTCTPAVAGTPVQLLSAWATATVYAVSNVRLDTDNTTWVCLAAHTSGNGTFAADRAANPTYWQQIITCKFVWIGAPVDVNDAPINQRMAMIGGCSLVGEPNIPLAATNYEGFAIRICDPSKIFVQSRRTGDSVAFRIFW